MADQNMPNDMAVLDRAHVFHPSMNLADYAEGNLPTHVIAGGKGIRLRDRDGREMIDGFAGLWCVNVGYGRTEIADAVHEQITHLNYYHAYGGHTSEPVIRLSQRLAQLAGRGLNHVFYGMSGSDANETNIKIVWYVNNVLGRPEKKKIITRERAYHGSGLMTGGLTGQSIYHGLFDMPMPQVRRVSAPHYWADGLPGESEPDYALRLASELEALILAEGPETVAAFIAEPVIGAGGILPPPQGYWPAVQAVLRKYDIMLIVDEVVTGFGRTGAPFASHLYDIQPDLMTVAKGITSGYVPLSGVLVSDRIWEILIEGTRRHGTFGHGWTYSAHPVSVAAANANLDIIEREGLVENARVTGAYLQSATAAAFGDHPMVGELRGVGLLAAMEFVAEREPRRVFAPDQAIACRVVDLARDRGLILRAFSYGQSVGLAPPLTVTPQDIDRMVEILAAAVETVFQSL